MWSDWQGTERRAHFIFNVLDLAVGAPYYGNGAVFIYNGQQGQTFTTKPSQVLKMLDCRDNEYVSTMTMFRSIECVMGRDAT